MEVKVAYEMFRLWNGNGTGTVQGIGQGGGHWYEFTSDEEKNWKTGIKGFFTQKSISLKTSVIESPAWHCPNCKKVLMWMDSKE